MGSDHRGHGNGPDSGITAPAQRVVLEQRVLNETWPYTRADGSRHAIGLDDKPANEQRPVWVRLQLERDGDTTLPARAVRWTPNYSHVYAVVDDPRVPRSTVWLSVKDVRRRVVSPPSPP